VNLVSSLKQLEMGVLDLLFPPRCVGCGSSGGFLCVPCLSALPYLPFPLCAKCGKPLSYGTVCYDCENYLFAFDGIRSLSPYHGVVRQAILQFKYQNVKALAVQLAQLMGKYINSHPLSADTLVPVPLHPRRLRERGYNQSSLLSRELSRLVPLPVVEGALLRARNTPAQTKTNSVQNRHSNVAGAFTCRGRRVVGKRILLIEDVCTPGATLNACATVLKSAGAISVWGLTMARDV
jgi:ComF family protein